MKIIPTLERTHVEGVAGVPNKIPSACIVRLCAQTQCTPNWYAIPNLRNNPAKKTLRIMMFGPFGCCQNDIFREGVSDTCQ